MELILFGPTQRRTTPTSSTRSAEASFSFILYLTIFTMLHDDITHPIPDPTDTITEGQVFVDNPRSMLPKEFLGWDKNRSNRFHNPKLFKAARKRELSKETLSQPLQVADTSNLHWLLRKSCSRTIWRKLRPTYENIADL